MCDAAPRCFVQVGIEDGVVDLSGICGNLASMIGVFVLDEGLCSPRKVEGEPSLATVGSFNTNTSKLIDTTFPVTHDCVPDLSRPEVETADFPGKASRIVYQFVNPGGGRTGRLLATDVPVDTVAYSDDGASTKPVSFVEATKPRVFVCAAHLASSRAL